MENAFPAVGGQRSVLQLDSWQYVVGFVKGGESTLGASLK